MDPLSPVNICSGLYLIVQSAIFRERWQEGERGGSGGHDAEGSADLAGAGRDGGTRSLPAARFRGASLRATRRSKSRIWVCALRRGRAASEHFARARPKGHGKLLLPPCQPCRPPLCDLASHQCRRPSKPDSIEPFGMKQPSTSTRRPHMFSRSMLARS